MAKGKELKISGKEIEKLAGYGLTNTEIANFFNCSDSSIGTKYGEFLTKGRTDLKLRLRKKQINVALTGAGNVSMLIWLGKQYLNQTDKIDNNNGLTDEQTEALRKLAIKEMSELL